MTPLCKGFLQAKGVQVRDSNVLNVFHARPEIIPPECAEETETTYFITDLPFQSGFIDG